MVQTSFDASATYMASGFLPSLDGNHIYLYSSGQPFTHGSDGDVQGWGANTGIRLLKLRKDGFVSVDAPYAGAVGKPPSAAPALTTTAVTVPSNCVAPQAPKVLVNFETSVVGYVAVELQVGGKPVATFGLADADPLKGNAVGAVASWGGLKQRHIASLAGKSVAFKVAMADARLFSIKVECA